MSTPTGPGQWKQWQVYGGLAAVWGGPAYGFVIYQAVHNHWSTTAFVVVTAIFATGLGQLIWKVYRANQEK